MMFLQVLLKGKANYQAMTAVFSHQRFGKIEPGFSLIFR